MDILKVLLIAYPLCCVCDSASKGDDQSIISCFHPPNGTVISTFIGSDLAITCNFSNSDTCSSELIITTWSILHFNSSIAQAITSVLSPSLYSIDGTHENQEYNNTLTLNNVSPILDGATIFCGTQSDKQLALFAMRIYAPPGPPHNLTRVAISDSWVTIQWSAPSDTGSHWISYYNLTVRKFDTNLEMSEVRLSTENNETRKNITQLLLGTSIKMNISVTAISRIGSLIAVGPASEPLVISTNAGDQHLQEENIIQLVLTGVLRCSQWVIINTDEKLKIIVDLLHENCKRCTFVITSQAIECTKDDNDVVKFRAKLFSTPNTSNEILNSINAWITNNPSIVVKGLRLYFKTSCPLLIKSFETPLRCISQAKDPENSVAVALAIIAFVICVILIATVVFLVIYIMQKQRYKNHNKSAISDTGNQPSECQLTTVSMNRAGTMSRMSIPETIPEIELEGCEKRGHEDFELSTSLAYGAVTSTSTSQLQLRPVSEVGSVSSDIEHNYINPLYYDGNPVYETILPI